MTKIAPLLALLTLAALPQIARAEGEGMPRNAFLFEARLGLGVQAAFTNAAPGVQAVPALLVGARLADRLHVGLGFGFERLEMDQFGGLGGGGTSSANVVTFAPTIAVDILKSRENKAAFYGKAALPLGPAITCQAGSACDNNFSIGFDLALGARYAFNHVFALGMEAGVAGSFLGPQRNNTTGFVTVYGALVGSFFWGR